MGRKHLYPPSVRHGIPRLGRLPRGWTKTTFGEQLQVVERPVTLADHRTYQLISAKRNRGGIVARETLRGDQILTVGQFRVEAGDFITSNRQIIHGACGIVPSELDGAIVSGEYTVLHARTGLHLPYFAHYTHSDYFQKSCFYASVGVDVEKMLFDVEQWLKLPFYLPPLAEQRRVALILAELDLVLANSRVVLERKLQLRRVVAKKLFFRDFSLSAALPRGWRRASLSDVATISTGSTPSRRHPEYFQGDIPWVKTTEVQFCEIFESEDHVSPAGVRAARLKIYPPGTVLMAMYGQGKTRGQTAILGVPAAINQACAAISPSGDISPWYLFHNLSCRYEVIRSGGQGSNQDNLNRSMVARLPLVVPPPEEQRSFVRHLDQWSVSLAAEEARLAALEKVKSKLANRLLTGELRVKV